MDVMLGNVALRARRCGGVRNAAKGDRGAVDARDVFSGDRRFSFQSHDKSCGHPRQLLSMSMSLCFALP